MAALACVLFLYLASGPTLGGWTTVVLVLVLLAVTARLFTAHPRLALLVPATGLALWLALVVVASR